VRDVDVTLRVSGTEHDLTGDARTTLLDALRERLGLTGAKKGTQGGVLLGSLDQVGRDRSTPSCQRSSSCSLHLRVRSTCQTQEEVQWLLEP
jgi:hypothetical protein